MSNKGQTRRQVDAQFAHAALPRLGQGQDATLHAELVALTPALVAVYLESVSAQALSPQQLRNLSPCSAGHTASNPSRCCSKAVAGTIPISLAPWKLSFLVFLFKRNLCL